jgi:glycosyltransferase involved in cell wall biosynthesis
MTINIFTIVWNEEFMLPHFLNHYSQFADRIFVIDHNSTDLTAEIAKAHPMVTYSRLEEPEYSEELISRTFEKYAKKNRSDWAVVVDCDEFVTGLDKLEKPNDILPSGIIRTKGYMMVGKTGKLEDCKPVRMKSFDKPIIFDPTLDIEFTDGRHDIVRRHKMSAFVGSEPGDDAEPYEWELLHYKYPSREYYYERNLKSYPRIMDEESVDYRLKRGLDWYDKHI